MSDDKNLKSAYELAMERLRAKDREEGVEESGPLDEKQKAEITRLRQEAKAKLAEMEILHKRNVGGAGVQSVASSVVWPRRRAGSITVSKAIGRPGST